MIEIEIERERMYVDECIRSTMKGFLTSVEVDGVIQRRGRGSCGGRKEGMDGMGGCV